MGGETVCEAFPRSCVSHCQVGMLYGAWQDIVGTLPAEVAGCAQMASIDLSNNLLSGTIPPEWGQLLEVFDVDLSSNLISGTLPPEWTTQRSMAQLKLNGNRLSGTIPEQLTPVSLQWAQFQRNNISGTLPASWAALASFEQLVAAGNRLSGTLPRGWATTPNGRRFTLLWLDDNSIEGTIPTEWAQTRFEELRLDRNRLSGVLPTELGGHPQALYMHALSLAHNQLSGSLPTELTASAWNLKTLDVRGNAMSGSLPRAACGLCSLEGLDASDNRLDGTLEWMDANATDPLCAPCLDHIGGGAPFAALDLVGLSNNTIEGTLPKSIPPALATLRLDANRISGTLPSMKPRTPTLPTRPHPAGTEAVALEAVATPGTPPDADTALDTTKDIAIGFLIGPSTTTTTPSSDRDSHASYYNWGGYDYDSYNNDDKDLPALALSTLTELQLHSNRLSGTLPSGWGDMNLLERLTLHVNAVSGTLPAAWKGHVSLHALDAHGNQLSGTIPMEWQGLLSDPASDVCDLGDLGADLGHLGADLGNLGADLGDLGDLGGGQSDS